MKRPGSFTILIVCMLFLLQNVGAQTQMEGPVIGIQYVGPSDKPVKPIVIAQSPDDADLFKKTILKMSDLEIVGMHVVPSSLMEKLVVSAKGSQRGRAGNKSTQAASVVLLTIATQDQTIEIHLGSNDCIEILSELGKISRGSPELEADIAQFQARIFPIVGPATEQ